MKRISLKGIAAFLLDHHHVRSLDKLEYRPRHDRTLRRRQSIYRSNSVLGYDVSKGRQVRWRRAVCIAVAA